MNRPHDTEVDNDKVAISAVEFPIVGVGASAGGLEALEQMLGGLPADSGMAFVVIQHLDPNRKGMLPELLQRVTSLPVCQAQDGQTIERDHIYVIPPSHDLLIERGVLRFAAPEPARGLRLPVDRFFESLAEDAQARAIGVVLSGMGSDGALGVRAIKARGGLVLIQEPSTARFDSMPRSAIGSGLADFVVSPREIPDRIRDALRAASNTAREARAQPPLSALEEVCVLLRARTGHDFSFYKKNTLCRRIERRMLIHKLDGMDDYVHFLRENPQEIDLLFKELLIGVTNFFRDPPVWEALQGKALPQLLARRPEGTTLRAWVAGCSTGEEAYTLAIAFREVLAQLGLEGRYALQIFATDLDKDAIERARQGLYPATIAAGMSSERLGRFFVNERGGYRVSKDIREMVVFAPQNVIADPPFTKLDILVCRNLLIYLGSELQKKLFLLFHYSLVPGGILLLGIAESVGEFADLFKPLDAKKRLFWRSSSTLHRGELDFPTRALPKKMEFPVKPKSDPAPQNLQNLADQVLLRQFSPAAVLVNGAGDLLYINGRTGKYLEPAAGKANWNIHAMAREGLRQELALALPKALRGNERVIRRNLRIGSADDDLLIDLLVQPIQEPAELRGMVMMVFSEAMPAAHGAPPVPGVAGGGQREAELERELMLARQELAATREEMQASQEELKSANEELQSTNEELQSTNEELTTSKEEMQSLNEELQTVNSELQAVNTQLQMKVEEAATAGKDMKNLLNSIGVATVFLDGNLRVRDYTAQAANVFKLIPTDVGRPLFDLVTDLDYPELADNVHEALERKVASERQVPTRDGRWFDVRIMPYRTADNLSDGLVITLIDVSAAKKRELELRKALGLAAASGGSEH